MSIKPKKITVIQTIYKDDTFATEAISTERTLTETVYNEDGQILEEKRYAQDGSIENTLINTYENGKLVMQEHQGEFDEFSEKLEFKYDDKGHLSKQLKHYADGSVDETIFSYNTQWQLIEKKTINDEGEQEEHSRYSYDGSKLATEETFDAEGELVSSHHNTYDAAGNVVEQLVDGIEGYQRTVHVFNNNNQRISTHKYNQDDECIEETLIEESEDRKLLKMQETIRGNLSFYNIELDAAGRQIKQEETDKDGDLISSIEREYDENGNLLLSKAMVYRPEFGTYQYYSISNRFEDLQI
jgi:hypothetical protein